MPKFYELPAGQIINLDQVMEVSNVFPLTQTEKGIVISRTEKSGEQLYGFRIAMTGHTIWVLPLDPKDEGAAKSLRRKIRDFLMA